jgi:hypothetical protein
VNSTRHVDAAFFDAELDAAPKCPDPATPPQFKGSLHQVNDNCTFYTRDEAGMRDAALCDSGVVNAPAVISDGGGDGLLTMVTLSPPLTSPPEMPRLSPEGDELWVRDGGKVLVYSHAGDHSWTFARDLGVSLQDFQESFTPPTRWVAGKRRFVLTTLSAQHLQEWEDDGTNVTLQLDYPASQEGTSFFIFPTLTADGLRLVWSGAILTDTTDASRTFYAYRQTLTESFSPGSVLQTAPIVTDAFLTADCGRIYTSGLGSIFFAEQI